MVLGENKINLKRMLVEPAFTLKEAMCRLSETAEKILFVVSKTGKLLGTITDGDIRRGIIKGMKFTDKIQKVMCRHCISVADANIDNKEQIKCVMLKNKIEQIPVLDGAGRVVDFILWTDILEGKKLIKTRQLLDNFVIIMAGGMGKRLDPFTRIFPKPLFPIGNKPVIDIIMEKFYAYGLHKFIYTLNYKKEYIKAFLNENKFSYEISYVEEKKPLGTAGSISLLKGLVKDTFFITNCDSILSGVDFEAILKWHKKEKSKITIIGCHNEIKIPFGVLELKKEKLSGILEKPVHEVIINTGVYVLEPDVISYVPHDKPIDMNLLINNVAKKEKVSVYPIHDGWFDIGQWEEYKNNAERLEGLKNE